MALVLPPSRDLPMDNEINKKLVCKPCNSTLVDEIMCVACDHKCQKNIKISNTMHQNMT